ncbi:MAG TPA: hypothetical protein VK572_07925, partial [Burkholderiales bacterium]|nr:hypothetical protein [Burkholderiales bacterium]
ALTTETSARETAVSAEKGARETADSTHAALTTTAHGGIVAGTDSRLTNARTPTAHASTHAEAGSDPLTTADLPSSVVNGSTAVLDVRQFLAGGVVDWAAALKAMEEQRKALLTPLDIALKEGPVLGNKEHVTGNVATFKYHFIFEGCPTITLPVMAEGQYATRFNETAEGVNVNAALYKHPDIILDGDFRIAGSGSGDGGSFMSAYRRTFAVNGVMSGETTRTASPNVATPITPS